MKRNSSLALNAELINNVMLMRQEFLRTLIDPKRDIDKECGYPENPSIIDYKDFYERGGIATRIVDIYPEESWATDPEVLEKSDGDYTTWEQNWKDLVDQFNLYEMLTTLDKISGIGHYGILMLGIDDGKPLNEPVEGIDLKTGLRVGTGGVQRKLLYVRPFDETVLTISQFESDRTSPRYGQPNLYQVKLANESNSNSAVATSEIQSFDLHWTRAVHVADGLRNSRVFGTPRMRKHFPRLCDLRKILGGAGEMFWKGGFPGIAFESMPNTTGGELTKADKLALRGEFENYQNGLQRYLALVGMTAKSLAPQVADPSNHFEVEVKAMCMADGIPYRIFMGSEEAQLAGAQDKEAWNKRLKKRQQKYIAPCIVRPVVDRLIALSVLEETEKYFVAFEDLAAPSPKDKAEVGAKRTEALAKYVAGNVDLLVPPLEFLTIVLGFETEEALSILSSAQIAADGTIERPEPEPEEVPAGPNGSRANGSPTRNEKIVKEFWSENDLAIVEKGRQRARGR